MARILVIEDEDLMRDLLRDLLEMEGHSVSHAIDGAAALSTFAKGQFDLVITDIIMDRMDGLEVIRNLRKQNPDLRIIAISGGGGIDARTYLEIAQTLGVNQTFAKPFDPDRFLAAISDLVPG